MKTSLSLASLSAALLIAPKTDIRPYLVSVHVAFHHGSDSNTMDIVSTNGHLLFKAVDTLDYEEDAQSADFALTIPRSTVEAACKNAKSSKRKTITLEALPDGRYMLGDVVFGAITDKFPDYERIIPSACSGQVAQFNYDYLALASNALKAAYDSKRIHIHLSHNGPCAAVMHTSMSNALVLVMPLRSDVAQWSA